MLSIDNLFVMDLFVKETQRLVDLAKQMNLEGKEVIEFFRAERALAMERRIRISKEEEEERIRRHKDEEKERIAAIEDEERIAAKAEKERIAAMEEEEKIMLRKKEDETRSAEEAAWFRRHKEEEEERIRRHKEEEEERIRRHEEEMCHLRREADNIRRRMMLQEVWKDAEERRREEEDEGECSISVTDRELWRKCFREQEALALEEAE